MPAATTRPAKVGRAMMAASVATAAAGAALLLWRPSWDLDTVTLPIAMSLNLAFMVGWVLSLHQPRLKGPLVIEGPR